jgi:hypothetical protein
MPVYVASRSLRGRTLLAKTKPLRDLARFLGRPPAFLAWLRTPAWRAGCLPRLDHKASMCLSTDPILLSFDVRACAILEPSTACESLRPYAGERVLHLSAPRMPAGLIWYDVLEMLSLHVLHLDGDGRNEIPMSDLHSMAKFSRDPRVLYHTYDAFPQTFNLQPGKQIFASSLQQINEMS